MREWLSERWLRVRTIGRRRRLDRDLDEEMAFHLALRAESLERGGVGERDASSAARRSFGNVTLLKETCRELWTFASLERWLADLRYASRSLRREPGFAVVAILSLALGIGANTAVVGVARAALVASLPVRSPGELRVLSWAYRRDPDSHAAPSQYAPYSSGTNGRAVTTNFSYKGYRALRERCANVADLVAFSPVPDLNVSVDNRPVPAGGLTVSDNYFTALGVVAALGRLLDRRDFAPGAPPVAVVGHSLWTREFGRDGAIVGKGIVVNGIHATIVGVTASPFYGVSKGGWFPMTDVTMPLVVHPLLVPKWNPENGSLFDAEDHLWLRVMGRVTHGMREERVVSALNAAYRPYVAASDVPFLRGVKAPEVLVSPGGQGVDTVGTGMKRPLAILAGVALLVLLIACLNLAGLALARGVARQREMHVRLTLGSGRLRLVRQLLAESLLLALAGGAAGLLIAAWGGRLLVTMLTARQGRVIFGASLDWPTLGIGLGISLAAALLFGLIPAFRVTSTRMISVLKENSASIVAPRLGISRYLMIGQVALSLVLLVGAAMFLRTLQNLSNVPLGFDPRGLVLFTIDPSLNGYEPERIEHLYSNALAGMQATPGVRSATLMQNALLSGWTTNTAVALDGKTAYVDMNAVGPRFFETMGIPLVAGRDFNERDDARAPKVAVVNETAARAAFGRTSPIGRTLRRYAGRSGGRFDVEVIGVVKDSKYDRLRKDVEPTLFVPYQQSGISLGGMWLAVRAGGNTAAVMASVRKAMAAVDPQVPVRELKTQQDQIGEALGNERFFARVLGFFGLFALLVACIGLHGITAYTATRRTSEIGVRMAFGATRGSVLWMVMRQVVVLTSIGLALGVPLAIAGSRVVRSMLFGVEPGDPATLAVAALLMALVALVAAWLPARRASRMDPLVALRYE